MAKINKLFILALGLTAVECTTWADSLTTPFTEGTEFPFIDTDDEAPDLSPCSLMSYAVYRAGHSIEDTSIAPKHTNPVNSLVNTIKGVVTDSAKKGLRSERLLRMGLNQALALVHGIPKPNSIELKSPSVADSRWLSPRLQYWYLSSIMRMMVKHCSKFEALTEDSDLLQLDFDLLAFQQLYLGKQVASALLGTKEIPRDAVAAYQTQRQLLKNFQTTLLQFDNIRSSTYGRTLVDVADALERADRSSDKDAQKAEFLKAFIEEVLSNNYARYEANFEKDYKPTTSTTLVGSKTSYVVGNTPFDEYFSWNSYEAGERYRVDVAYKDPKVTTQWITVIPGGVVKNIMLPGGKVIYPKALKTQDGRPVQDRFEVRMPMTWFELVINWKHEDLIPTSDVPKGRVMVSVHDRQSTSPKSIASRDSDDNDNYPRQPIIEASILEKMQQQSLSKNAKGRKGKVIPEYSNQGIVPPLANNRSRLSRWLRR